MIEILLQFIMWMFLVLGTFYIASGCLTVGDRKGRAAANKYFKKKKVKKDSAFDGILRAAGNKLAKYIYINDIKRSKYKKLLHLADIEKTPEQWLGEKYVLCGTFVILGGLVCLISKIGFLVIGVAIFLYWMQLKELKDHQKSVIKDVELELPKFVAYINQILPQKPDALYVLTSYISTNDKFKKELNYTIADIRSSDYISGINRLNSRISSDRLKQVTDGLISIYNGTYDEFYFAMLEKDFTAFEINELKRQIKKIPQKMQLPKILMVLAVLITLMTPMIMQIVTVATEIFTKT